MSSNFSAKRKRAGKEETDNEMGAGMRVNSKFDCGRWYGGTVAKVMKVVMLLKLGYCMTTVR